MTRPRTMWQCSAHVIWMFGGKGKQNISSKNGRVTAGDRVDTGKALRRDVFLPVIFGDQSSLAETNTALLTYLIPVNFFPRMHSMKRLASAFNAHRCGLESSGTVSFKMSYLRHPRPRPYAAMGHVPVPGALGSTGACLRVSYG